MVVSAREAACPTTPASKPFLVPACLAPLDAVAVAAKEGAVASVWLVTR